MQLVLRTFLGARKVPKETWALKIIAKNQLHSGAGNKLAPLRGAQTKFPANSLHYADFLNALFLCPLIWNYLKHSDYGLI